MNAANPIQDAIRSIFVSLDVGIYSLLKLIYEIFFNITTINILDREMIFTVFTRVQLVIGIFMMFQLVMIVIKGIVNPDSATDAKSGGGITVVVRIIVSLALLALIVPINIPSPRNEYEKQINNNGLLFGTLYSLQYRILSNNTIGNIILGNDSANYTDGGGAQDLSRFANRFTSTIVKTFYTLNTDEQTGAYVCNDGFDHTYYQDDVDPIVIILNGQEKCGSSNFILEAVSHILDPAQIFRTGRQYRITMNWISTIAGIVIVVLFFMMTFNVAKRVFKLAALQLIAPIPIISYMDPKGSKDGAFNSWLKLLGTTYLELFIQLAVIYFSFAIINMFIVKFFSVNTVTSAVGNAFSGDVINAPLIIGFTFIIMVIALFIFAKDAPKFFKQMLGIKDNGGSFFGSFGTAMGLGVAAAGALGSYNASRQASRDSLATRLREQNGNLTEAQARAMANRGMANRARHALSGIFGAGVGLAQGSAAASESKGNALAKVMASANAMNARNQKVRAAGVDGGSFFGAVGSLGDEILHGENDYDRRERRLKAEEQRIKNAQTALKTRQDELKTAQSNNDHRKSIMDRAKSKATDCDYTEGTYKGIIGNYRGFHSAYEAAINNGVGVHIQYVDAGGTAITKAQYDALSAAQQNAYHEESWFEYSYTDRAGVAHNHQKINMADAKDIDMGLYDKNTEDFYEEVVRYETSGGTTGHNDDSIAADRAAYRTATGGHDLEAVYGTPTGLKAEYGHASNANKAEADDISRVSQELSRRSQAVNDERQSLAALREKADAERLRKGGKS